MKTLRPLALLAAVACGAVGCLPKWPPSVNVGAPTDAAVDVVEGDRALVVDAWLDDGPAFDGAPPGDIPDVVDSSCLVSPDGPRVLQIAVGVQHACALLWNRRVYCWGLNNGGQAGVPPTSPELDGGTCGDAHVRSTPSPVESLPPCVTAISAGGDDEATPQSHSCALAEGTVYCWGNDFYGQVTGTPANDASVARPPGAIVDPSNLPRGSVIQVSTGSEHTCALLQNRSVVCWGNEHNGRRGSDSTDPFVLVNGLDGGVVEVVAGYETTCVRLDDGRAICWGAFGGGQLGADSGVAAGGDGNPAARAPVRGLDDRGPLVGIAQIAPGEAHTCARLDGGAVYCWGDPALGALGIGAPGGGVRSRPLPPATILPDGGAAGLVSGKRHSCAIVAGGREVWCWGDNNYRVTLGGREGTGGACPGATGRGCLYTPDAVRDLNLEPGETVRQLSTSLRFTCALTNHGRVLCWGFRDHAQLGDGCGTQAEVSGPRLVNF